MRMLTLPAGLSPTAANYMAGLIPRNHVSDATGQIYLGKTYALNGEPPDSFSLVATLRGFAWTGTLTGAFLASAAKTAVGNALPALPPEVPASSPFPLVAGLAIQLTGPDLILDDITDFDALAGALLVFVDNEIMSIELATLTGVGAYTLTVIRGMFGTVIADHAAAAAVYVVRRSDLVPFTHPLMQAGNILTFKIVVGLETVGDSVAVDYEVGGGLVGLAWTSITPNTVVNNTDNPDFVIAGSDFLSLGVNLLRVGPAITYYPSAVYDAEIDFSGGINFFNGAPGVYTLYFSTDNGATWTSTGLSITVT